MFSFVPIVRNNAVVSGCSACEDGSVSRTRIGGHVVVMQVARVCAVAHEALESALAVVVPESIDVVVAHLINGYSNHKGRKRLIGRRSCFLLSESRDAN